MSDPAHTPATDDLGKPAPSLGEDIVIPRAARQHQNFAPYMQNMPAMDDEFLPSMVDRLAFVLALVGLILGSLAMLFAFPFVLYASFVGHPYGSMEESVNPLDDPFASTALLGTLFPLGLSVAGWVIGIRNSLRVSVLVMAGCGIAVSIMATALVLLGYHAMITVS